uniref:Uncharacterized protein n=2 Tax=unclassified Candidatus Kentrum TaxID=2643149 RepID=A0A450VXD5_9GAMM|nr:MAG: hypothetical protein BECKLPF1236B_GA0070989_10086 [Candidatus Kentron sp. LPFa]
MSSRHRKNKNSEQIGARARNTPFGSYCYANMLDLIRNFRLGRVRHGAWISIETVDAQFHKAQSMETRKKTEYLHESPYAAVVEVERMPGGNEWVLHLSWQIGHEGLDRVEVSP